MQTLVVTHHQQRKLQKARHDHQGVTDVAGQAEEHFQFHAQRQVRVPDAAVQFEPDLQHTFGSTALLGFEGIDLDRNCCRRFFIQQVNKAPAHQLRAETQVRVFSQRVVLPAAAQLDRFAAPDPGGAVKVEEVSGAITRRLLNYKVAVEHDGLQTSQEVVRPVNVPPTHLRTTDCRVSEVMHQLAEEIRFRHKVSVKDRNQFTAGRLHSIFQSAGLEPGAVVAMNVMNIES